MKRATQLHFRRVKGKSYRSNKGGCKNLWNYKAYMLENCLVEKRNWIPSGAEALYLHQQHTWLLPWWLENHFSLCSRFLSSAESNYAVIEGESLAVAWSLEQTRFFTTGCSNLLKQRLHCLDWAQLLSSIVDNTRHYIRLPQLLFCNSWRLCTLVCSFFLQDWSNDFVIEPQFWDVVVCSVQVSCC